MNLSKLVINKLIKKNLSISVAESCTGGLMSKEITSYSGVSKIFQTGLVTYSNLSKMKFLNIKKSILKKYGAVSYETANAMVLNLKKLTKSNICISTTGIAGPLGGTKKKPVGLVFIGIIYKNKKYIIEKKFTGSRNSIRNKTINSIFKKINTLI